MRTIIVGLGNRTWGDDSVDPRVAHFLHNRLTQFELDRELGLPLPGSVAIFAIEIGQSLFPQKECTRAIQAAIPI